MMLGINGALKAVGYGLLVLFFAAGVVKTCGSLTELKRPEAAVRLFVRFVLAKAAVGYGLDLMMAIFSVAQGTISTVTAAGGLTSGAALPSEIVDKINAVSFWDSIPLWAVTLLGSLFITVLFLYAAIAPIPLATFAGEPSSSVGKNFLRSYAGVCLEGLVIALSCVIFSAMASSPPAVDPNASAVTAVWTYVAELIFNFLVLVGSIKMSDQVVKELMGL